MKLRWYERLAVWLLFTYGFCGGCMKHSESKLDASLARAVDTSEPVAVPKSFRFRGWSPIVPNAGGLLSPPTASPLPEVPFVAGADGGFAYFEGEVDYGEGEKKTHEADGSEVHTEGSNDSKPAGILDLISAHWPWLLLLIPVAVILFRKHPRLARLLKLLPFPFSLLAPKD